MRQIKLLIYGIIARILNCFLSVKKKQWVLGADYGQMYREGSKYLLEYMIDNHKDYDCTFITMSSRVYTDLKEKNIPCEMNLSLKGIIKILRAEVVFTTQVISDIRFAYKKKNRKYIYLTHGMPYKRAMAQLPKGYISNLRNVSTFKKISNKISSFLTLGYKMKDVCFIPSTSDFVAKLHQLEFPYNSIKVIGLARNDALFQDERMKKEKWIDGIDDKFVIVYMPTHRGYGAGKVSPIPFKDRKDVQDWLVENNVVLLVKNHPNMINKIDDIYGNEVIKDISKEMLDPQVCIYKSDVLITDHSSVWMDYLLLKRPILFYFYDDFEHNDVGTYYDIEKENVGAVSRNEDELFNLIKETKSRYCEMIPPGDVIRKFHKFVDGNSCERMYNEICIL